jgi:hypothetical protein
MSEPDQLGVSPSVLYSANYDAAPSNIQPSGRQHEFDGDQDKLLDHGERLLGKTVGWTTISRAIDESMAEKLPLRDLYVDMGTHLATVVRLGIKPLSGSIGMLFFIVSTVSS